MNFTLEHLGLAARNPMVLKDWYLKVLGAEVVFDNQQPSRAFLLALPGGPLIEIYQADLSLAETSINALAGWRHVALRVESIEASRSLLESRGVKFPDPVKPAGGGGRVLFFRDAEENLLHLVERPAGFVFNPTS